MDANKRLHKKTINGKEYTAQYYGQRAAMKMRRECRDDKFANRQDEEKVADYILRNVIVDPPGLEIESFDDYDELTDVVTFGLMVLNNRFQQDNETGAKGRSKK